MASRITFESVNKEIEALNLDQLVVDIHEGKRLKSISATSRVCIVWEKTGGVVKFIAKNPLLPKKWKQALELLIKTMDALCE
jgi:hypothetical protein